VRDRFITVYGRMPVLEALGDESLQIDKVLLATNARGSNVDAIVAAAEQRGVAVERAPAAHVTRVSRNGRHDQGVVADVVAPRLGALENWLADGGDRGPWRLLLLDAVSNPANVGMIVRTATAAGLTGVVLPRAGCPDVGPLVVKASAGVAFRATILRTPTADEAAAALHGAGVTVYGLRTGGADRSVFDTEYAQRSAFVLGNETSGVSPPTAAHVDEWITIPLAGGIDSLNVASAAAVLAFEVMRPPRAPR
jgi:23S rRNA (guanosine2251-2'-O)-methyltransferase